MEYFGGILRLIVRMYRRIICLQFGSLWRMDYGDPVAFRERSFIGGFGATNELWWPETRSC